MPTIIRSRSFGSSGGGVAGGESSIGVDAVECFSSEVSMPSPWSATARFVADVVIFQFGSVGFRFSYVAPDYRLACRRTWFWKNRTEALEPAEMGGQPVEMGRTVLVTRLHEGCWLMYLQERIKGEGGYRWRALPDIHLFFPLRARRGRRYMIWHASWRFPPEFEDMQRYGP